MRFSRLTKSTASEGSLPGFRAPKKSALARKLPAMVVLTVQEKQ
jgi:hypothetical protein